MAELTPERMQETRLSFGLSQSEWAVLFHTHVMTVSRWERGHSDPGGLIRSFYRIFRQVSASKARGKEALKHLDKTPLKALMVLLRK